MHRYLPPSGNVGFSLVSILVALVIGSITIAVATQIYLQTSNYLATLSDETELSGPRNLLLIRSGCLKMRETLTCQPSIPILDPNGRTIVAANGSTKVGRYRIKASCANKRVNIQVAVDGVAPWINLFPKSAWSCLLTK